MSGMPNVNEPSIARTLLRRKPDLSIEIVERTTSHYAIAKRLFDVIMTSGIFILTVPIIVFFFFFLLIFQGRPIFIKHYRVGRNGRRFPCYKFRTMVKDADEVLTAHLASNAAFRSEWDATRKLKRDPRVTPIGAVLRKSSVDELPQLWNVMLGDMSLVGPRPIVDKEIVFYGAAISKYYDVRPGLTGPWQISGRSDVSYATRVRLDEDYIDNRSFQRDLSILFKTVPAVMRMRGSY